MRLISFDQPELFMDFGTILLHSDKPVFRSADTGNFMPVEDMAQGAAGFIEAFSGQPVSILYSEIRQPREKTKMMLHQIVRHKDVEKRAYVISESPENANPEENWLRAELELLHINP